LVNKIKKELSLCYMKKTGIRRSSFFWCALLLHNLGGSNPHVNFSLSSNVAEATFSPKRKDGQGVFCEEESERSAGKVQPETMCEPEVAAILGDPPKKRGNLCESHIL